MSILQHETQTAVAARMVARLVLLEVQTNEYSYLCIDCYRLGSPPKYDTHQIDVHFRVAERTAATVARHNARAALFRRHLGNQIDGPVRVDHTLGVLEPNVAIVFGIENLLGCDSNVREREKVKTSTTTRRVS